MPHTEPTYAYLPVLIDAGRFGTSRDELYVLLRHCNIAARKYFYPLISAASCYSALPSAASSNLPVAERVAKQVLCLPIYGTLEANTVRAVCGVIAAAQQLVAPKIALAPNPG
jgi:dTDP-4-amino-4,6-dideoxygalactose transaminase